MTFLEIPGRDRMVEAAMDAYFNWREERTAVSEAFRRWADSPECEADPAWQAYEAAYASEEDASLLYLELARRVGRNGAHAGPVAERAAGR
jgi:hypothetical protein